LSIGILLRLQKFALSRSLNHPRARYPLTEAEVGPQDGVQLDDIGSKQRMLQMRESIADKNLSPSWKFLDDCRTSSWCESAAVRGG
jgi:hypothetical protein